jgi:hypothetical protein
MRRLVIFIFLACLLSVNTLSQQLSLNSCDSTILNKEEFEKCKIDSVWTKDIIIKMNYISSLKTGLLPKYKVQRLKIHMPQDLKVLVKQIRHLYDSTLNHKLAIWEKEIDMNQKYVQPKAYISTLLSFRLFKFYPDVYAILLNDIHLNLKPKTSSAQIENFRELFVRIITKMPKDLYQEILKITTEFHADKLKLTNELPLEMFQGNRQDPYIISCNIINFLIWTE